MSKLWTDLKENMKDWSNAAIEKAEEVSKVAVAKTEELTKISKIKLEIHQLERNRRREREALGKLVYGQAKNDNMVNFTGNAEFFTHVEKIESISAVITGKNNEIERIKDEYDIQDVIVSEAVDVEPATVESSEEGEVVSKPENE
ncbi:MAG: hypothetical protein HOA15_00935 [Candidatus Marinimicrobia bacterium]|jgi:hypothetical protein|nr:hypothetical protein [Candidatus Neomarinimicrobiota bacterium]MBT3675085.1 hypothetical protein [Candidatus Neomarinimicrobiota bacterium]MBT3763908.1 hypothetical protein [Candidatus Neomarinimicrobiota bacterium]MBT4067548.1 hypothetical protein [Candidatus Neomarinimicrobiota bacterium]MBT4269919.1 hypothetical protein [Candidatus Neomarinimicrobiota bacterium]